MGFLMDDLLAQEGVLDVFYQPIMMKKQRPAVLLTLLVKCSDQDRLSQYLLLHSSSLGVRHHEVERSILDRSFDRVKVGSHDIQIKLASQDGELIRVTPEYDDLARIAALENQSYPDIYQQALHAIEERYGKKECDD